MSLRNRFRPYGPVLIALFFLPPQSLAMVAPPTGVFVLPLTCSELLPDMKPYLDFFEAVARGSVAVDRSFSRRMFKILSLREKLVEAADRAREQNPIDVLIRKTLCFYREQREPLKAVSFDDPLFMQFMRSSLKELEKGVSQVLFDWEYDLQQRKQYERQMERNQDIVETVREQADVDADRTFEKIAAAAKRKVRQ